jgi:hypothetical protein
MRNAIAVLGFILLAASAHAQTTVPFSFSAGAPARATEVNGNFQALATAINNLGTRIDRLEGGALSNASISGTYQLFGFQTGVMAGGSGLIETITYTGSVTLVAGGTYTGTLNEFAHDLGLNSGANATMQTRNTPGEPVGGSYGISQNTKLTLNTFGGPDAIDFYGAAGARILVGVFHGEAPPPGVSTPMGTNTLLVLVRTN